MTLKTGVMTAEISALHHTNKLHLKLFLNCNYVSQNYCIFTVSCHFKYYFTQFYCIFSQINAVLPYQPQIFNSSVN